MDDLKDQLHKIGLENCDIDLYITLLHHGELSGSELAEKLSISRSSAARKLDCLIDHGLVEKCDEGFTCRPPEALVDIIETQKAEVVAREKLVQDVLAKLNPLYHKGQDRPYIWNINSREELRRAQRIFETLEDDILQIVSLDACLESLNEDSLTDHRDALKNSDRKIRAIIVGESDAKLPEIQAEYVLLPPELRPIPGEITLCGDYILMFSYQKSDEFSAVEIRSPAIAETLRFTLELAWQRGVELAGEIRKK